LTLRLLCVGQFLSGNAHSSGHQHRTDHRRLHLGGQGIAPAN